MALFIGAKIFYVTKNKYVYLFLTWRFACLTFSSLRQKKWDSMSSLEKRTYLETTNDKGNKRYVLLLLCIFEQLVLTNSAIG